MWHLVFCHVPSLSLEKWAMNPYYFFAFAVLTSLDMLVTGVITFECFTRKNTVQSFGFVYLFVPIPFVN